MGLLHFKTKEGYNKYEAFKHMHNLAHTGSNKHETIYVGGKLLKKT